MKLLLRSFVSSSIVCVSIFLWMMMITCVAGRSGKIVGGTPVLTTNEFPFFAYPASNYICGASLIHGDILISAAHCGNAAWRYGIYLGGTRLDDHQTSVYYSVNKTVTHPSYNTQEYSNDVMLIKINGFATTTPLALANNDTSLPTNGQLLTAIGYGVTLDGGSISNDLLKVNFNTVSYEECFQNYSTILINDTMVCSGIPEGGKDTCQGDSGGPILISGTNTIIGLISFGDGCAQVNTPSVNTRISYYNKWIHDTICSLSSQPPSSCACTAKGGSCTIKRSCCGPIQSCTGRIGYKVCG